MSKLVYEVKDLKGYVLGVGNLKDKILKEMQKNDYIEVNLLTNEANNFSTRFKRSSNEKKKKGKSVNIKKLRKSFRKKKPDYIICNIDDVSNYLKSFIKDSLYITNNKIFIYSEDNSIELENIIKRYKRYVKDITVNKDYIIVESHNFKTNIFKNIWYYIVDTITNFYEFIGNILAG